MGVEFTDAIIVATALESMPPEERAERDVADQATLHGVGGNISRTFSAASVWRTFQLVLGHRNPRDPNTCGFAAVDGRRSSHRQSVPRQKLVRSHGTPLPARNISALEESATATASMSRGTPSS